METSTIKTFNQKIDELKMTHNVFFLPTKYFNEFRAYFRDHNLIKITISKQTASLVRLKESSKHIGKYHTATGSYGIGDKYCKNHTNDNVVNGIYDAVEILKYLDTMQNYVDINGDFVIAIQKYNPGSLTFIFDTNDEIPMIIFSKIDVEIVDVDFYADCE